jgi:hypothetical protein
MIAAADGFVVLLEPVPGDRRVRGGVTAGATGPGFDQNT